MNLIEMNVLPTKIFPPYGIAATCNSIGSLTQQPRSIYSAGATRDRPLCAFPPVERFPLATMAISLPLSWRATGRRKLSKINSMIKGMTQGFHWFHSNSNVSMTEEEKFKELIKAMEKTAKFHVYVQDIIGGANPTVWEVAQAAQTVNSPTAFGEVRVVDDLVTAEADPNSEKLGRTQGTITYSDMSEPALTMNLTFYFTGGEYKGNSISIGGRNPINNKDREMPIVGGTGVFRMARGRVTEMEKLVKIVSSIISHGSSTRGEEAKLKKLIKAKEKTAKIHVYVQDALGGSNPTVWEVARSVQTVNSPTTFGQVRVVDDLLTAGSDRNSEKLGRAQGLITFSDLSESALTMNLTFYFNGGEHKGSSICIGGRNPINNKDRELPIIGGTGVFRMARGYSISNTFSFDPVANYGVLEYTFYVAYPDHE